MTEILAQRAFLAPATVEAIDDLHTELDILWQDADFVPDLDQMAFTTAVIEASSNVVQHGVALEGSELKLGVDLTVTSSLLQARISEIGATVHTELPAADLPGDDFESGRGLALIHALVSTVTVERQGNTNVWILSRESPQAGSTR
ncbi:ATP-binding protein [Arthrobacter sp. Br18]|uniref:ATP-binding protein n=1 Tax=Arthrobacter sp. Br18 TaxID=1312954 RepID=UPI00047DBF2E|nr:ATP-binding protein [Arthrobacter sp. Br18]